MLPLKDNVPTRAFPIVTVGDHHRQRDRLGLGVHRHVGRRPTSSTTATTRARSTARAWPALHARSPGTRNVFTVDVHARRLGAHHLQHAVPVDLREQRRGRARPGALPLWYLAAGLAATAVQTIVTLHWGTVPDASIPNIGASGAIAGVLGAYLVLLPHARVLTAIFFVLIFFRELPAVFSSGSGSCSSSGWAASHSCSRRPAEASPSSPTSAASSSGVLTVRLVAVRQPLQPAY